jgi:hypothetical protein
VERAWGTERRPHVLAEQFVFGGASRFAQTKTKLAVNNLFNDQNIVGVNPASTKTSVPAPGDVLNIMAARSVSLTFTIGVSAARPSSIG